MPARPGWVCTLIPSTCQGEPQLQIFEGKKVVIVSFRADGDCRVHFFFQWFAFNLFMLQVKGFLPFYL